MLDLQELLGVGRFSMVGGAYTHLDDMLASLYQSLDNNIFLFKVVSVGRSPTNHREPLHPS